MRLFSAAVRIAICFVASCTTATLLDAQEAQNAHKVQDTTIIAVEAVASIQPPRPKSVPWVTRRELAGFGLSIAMTLAVSPLDKPAANEFKEPGWQSSRTMQNVTTDLAFIGGPGPFIVGGGMFALGELGRFPQVASAGEHMTEAVVIAASLTALGKGIAGRALPGVQTSENFEWARGFHRDNGPFVSFPSGHTAAAFALASSLTGEAGAWRPGMGAYVGPVAYTVATAVGLARVYQRVHWMSDLPLAAAIGTWSGLSVESHVHRQSTNGVRNLLESATVERAPTGATVVGFMLPFGSGNNLPQS